MVSLTSILQRPSAGARRFSPIGLELDGPFVRAVQLFRTHEGMPQLHACIDLAVPDFTDSVSRSLFIASLLERRGFVGSDIALAAPVQALESDLLELPEKADRSATLETARETLARATRCPQNDIEVAAWDRPVERGTSTAYAVGLRHASAYALIEPFDVAGLNTVRVACPASSLAAILPYVNESSDGCTALLRLGCDAHLLVLATESTVVYQRVLHPTGWTDVLDSDVLSSESLPQASLLPVRKHLTGLASEVVSTLDCVPRTFGRLQIKSLLLTGPGAEMPAIQTLLEQSLPSLTTLPLRTWPASHPSIKPTASLDIALGLALEEVPS